MDYRWRAVDPEGLIQDPATVQQDATFNVLEGQGTATPACQNSVGWVFGGDSSCSRGFEVSGSFRVEQRYLGFPTLSAGRVVGTLSNPAGKVYHEWACIAKSPRNDLPVASAPAECRDTPLLPTDKVKLGAHVLKGDATFEFCLNPILYFGCVWQVQADLSGGVSS